MRDNAANRDAFGVATATVLDDYLSTHWGISLGGGANDASSQPVSPTTGIVLQATAYKIKGVCGTPT